MPRRTLALLNPRSGSSQPDDLAALLHERIPDCALFVLERDTAPAQLHSAISNADLVIACGGDGTVSAAAQYLRRDATLAIVPTGTANLLAGELGIPDDLAQAVEIAASGADRPIDRLVVGDRVCLCRAAAGDFARIGSRTNSALKQQVGNLAYVLNALDAVADPSMLDLEIELDGAASRVRCSSVIVTNIARMGRGSTWAPQMAVDDGQMHVLVFTSRSPAEHLDTVWRALSGDVRDGARVRYAPANRDVRIRAREKLPIVVDGEPVEDDSLVVRLEPRSMVVRTPR